MSLLTTPLDSLHRELGAKMVPFAGYDMPVQYPSGIIKEHLHTRESAGLFDVSHMGQVILEGEGSTAVLESLVPVDIEGLGENRHTYALFTNDQGGIMEALTGLMFLRAPMVIHGKDNGAVGRGRLGQPKG